ncbi:MAG: gfo/Idh/MocA family oxidoreductase, partial [bacterium]|nr:gfo/Idh/MocA family oxidoreductase [bacterium]
MTRRDLFRSSAAAMSAASYSQVVGANDKVRAGLIGVGGRGSYLMRKFQEQSVKVAAVCDVY